MRLKRRVASRRDVPLHAQLRDDAAYVVESALASLWLRECNSVGPWVRAIGGRPIVENRGHIEIGERSRFVCRWAPVSLRAAQGGTLTIGASCSVNYGTTLEATKSVTIGSHVDIGPYCVVADTEVPENGTITSTADAIEIGDRVWLASRVTVLPGARIGAGSVITAGSIVSGEIPSGVIAGGTPARVIRRLDASEVATLAEIEPPRPIERTAAASKAPSPPVGKGLLISDFTMDELARCIAADAQEPALAAEPAVFGAVLPTLMAPPVPEIDFAVVWTRPEAIIASFACLLEYEAVDHEALLAEVDAYAERIAKGVAAYRFAIVPTWTLPSWRRGLGLADARAGGISFSLHAMNVRLMEKLSTVANVFVVNAERWLAAGKGYNEKLWYMGKVPFAPAVFEEATQDIKAAWSAATGRARKLLVLDLDDTLWGGIVGDVGWEQLRLGGHDSVGEAFIDFQRALKSLKRRGILLALVSKNEESVALEAIRKHPEMVLRESDFVAHRINWQDKARNIAEIVQSLNLGLQSVVFIDDNPFERTRVREALPEVFVPEWPEDKLAYPSALFSLRCFDTPTISAEDLARTEMYTADREREALKAQVGSVDDWLRSLDLRVKAEPLSGANLARTSQLLNKTNQLNLRTRRLTESELDAWTKQPGHWLYAISVSDRVGSAGLTGVLSLQANGNTAQVVDFVLSCRVMGRRIEELMVHLAVEIARENKLSSVVAELLPTAKNKPTARFFEGSGLSQLPDSQTFVWDASVSYPRPDVITLERSR